MSSEWANRFRDFALAVDYIDGHIIRDAKQLLSRYFTETLETYYFGFFVQEGHTKMPGIGVLPTLEVEWSSTVSLGS